MIDIGITATSLMHVVHARCTSARRRRPTPHEDLARDRGAVSLEQVLWFVAAGVSVAVIAAILWNRIREEASTPINAPTAP